MIRRKIRIYLIGGLGNQIFGYAFAEFLKTSVKAQIEISDKYIKFGSNPKRKFQIDKIFKYDTKINFKSQSKFAQNLLSKSRIMRSIFWRISHFFENIQTEVDWEKGSLINLDKIYFRDYFQEWTYADLVNLKKLVSHTKKIQKSRSFGKLDKELKEFKPICIHIRVGDYLNFPDIYKLAPEDYFLKSIRMLSGKTRKPIWVFCESKSELKKYYPNLFLLSKKIFDADSDLTDMETFKLLSNSSNLITTNSTFSLWAGWLAANSGAKVVSLSENNDLLNISNYYKWYRYSKKHLKFLKPTSEPIEFKRRKAQVIALANRLKNE